MLDITDGTPVPLQQFITRSSQQVLELEVDPAHCFVSDLDAYDTLKAALEHNQATDTIRSLARDYWSKLIQLSDFTPGAIKRPEVMITYDIPPNKLRTR